MKFDVIHEDERGMIASFTDDLIPHEVAVFTTKVGFARGGCVHNENDEYLSVIEGSINLYLNDCGTHYSVHGMTKGAIRKIPKGIPHFYTAHIDSAVIEWGAAPEEKQNKHEPTRKMVEDINDKITSGLRKA